LSQPTHGGAVVFRLTRDGPRYLLVEASGTRGRWVFPKGHIEKGETAADTALREVSEEAGVRASPIQRMRRVEQKQDGKSISIVYFLMAHAGRARPLDKRSVRWLAFDEAFEALDRPQNRRLLRSADRMVSLATAKMLRLRVRRTASRLVGWLVRGARALLPRGRSRGRRRKSRARRPA
jgi:8-oxo-dGTP pyrophosphatase MutT (NUDIX family)